MSDQFSRQRFLSICMKNISELDPELLTDKSAQIAGEMVENSKAGLSKSFVFNINPQIQASDNDENYDKFCVFLKDMNDLRYYISEQIRSYLEKNDDTMKNFESLIKTQKKKKTEEGQVSTGKRDSTNALNKTIRSMVSEFIAKNPERFDKYNKGKLPYWISYDLEPKIKSYIKLVEIGGLKEQKNVFEHWPTYNEEDGEGGQELHPDLIKSILGIKIKKYSVKKFKQEILERSFQVLGGRKRFKNIQILKDGRIKSIRGKAGVDEYNILMSQINIIIGQYVGQNTNRILCEISDMLSEKIDTKKKFFKILRQMEEDSERKQFVEKIKEHWSLQIELPIKRMKLIKGYPSFPSFHPSEYYNNVDFANKEIKELIRKYEDLCSEIIKKPLDQEMTLKRVFHIKEVKKFTDVTEEMIRNLLKEESLYFHDVIQKHSKDETENKNSTDLQNSGVSAQIKRMYRRLLYKEKMLDFEYALDKEVDYHKKKLKKMLLKGRYTAIQLQQISVSIQKILRILLNSRLINDSYERAKLDVDIKRICGDLQMQKLKSRPHKQFSFAFRQLDQSYIYPVVVPSNGKTKVFFYIQIFNPDKAKKDFSFEYISYEDKNLVYKQEKNKDRSSFVMLPMVFSKRLGRKFVFNSKYGIISKQDKTVCKFGAPNFFMRFERGQNVRILGNCAFGKQLHARNLLQFPSKIKEQYAKSKFLLENVRYLIGIDRGENKLFSITVFDLENKKAVEQCVIGESFKQDISDLKMEQQDAQRKFRKGQLTAINKKITGKIDALFNEAISNLLKTTMTYKYLAAKYDKKVALIFEYLPKQLGRQGRRAYVELRQMGKLIESIKEARNFYDLGFHIFEISAAYTSQICSCCGTISKDSRKGERFECVVCKYQDDADLQASKNILVKWLGKKNFEIKNKLVKSIPFGKDDYSVFVKNEKTAA